jgi:F0F1-type ATP synthase membrane subunit c/vacuolar-type H+-ATPase subunit K
MLLAAVIYVFLSEAVKRDRAEELSQATYVAVAVMAALSMGAALMVRQAMVSRALETLQLHPEDSASAKRWFGGNMILFALCESVVVYGLVLRFIGATWIQVAPFYLAGIVLLILFRPRIS